MVVQNHKWNLKGPELLVECYLRLNGYFIINNFILHKQHGSQKTEVDLIGVRFPNQIEILKDDGGQGQPQELENDDELVAKDNVVDITIAEVKKGMMVINGPFEKEDVLEYIINWIGCLNDEEKPRAIEGLKKKEDFLTDDGRTRIRFVCFGGEKSEIKCRQILLFDVLKFIRTRFRNYSMYKTHSDQWSGVMKYVYDSACSSVSDDNLLKIILNGTWSLSYKP